MRKFLAVLLIFGGISAALSAQIQLSAGLGGNFTADFTSVNLKNDATGKAEDRNTHLLGGGFYAFFDASYVEANIGLLFGNSNRNKKDGLSDDEKKGMDVTALKLGLFGKYPITLGNLTLFPMLGIDGQIWLAGKANGKTIDNTKVDGNKTMKDMARDIFNQFWFKAGVGFDVPITEKFYFRAEALYGVRLNTKSEQDVLKDKTDIIDNPLYNSSDPDSPEKITQKSSTSYNSIIGHGLDIRLSVGYKF